jgi:hypothetical protein
VGDIKLEVGKLSKHWERAIRERSPPLLPTGTSPLEDPKPAPSAAMFPSLRADPKPSSASGRPSASDKVNGPRGHCFDNYHREGGFGSVATVAHPPVKGAFRLPTPPTIDLDTSHVPRPKHFAHPVGSGGGGQGRLPKLNFPSFDGTDPKLWLSRCVDYFELYDVEQPRWIMVATMHFVPPAAH